MCLYVGVAVPADPHWSVVAVHRLKVGGAPGAHHPTTAPTVVPPVELDRERKKRERKRKKEL